MAPGRASGRVGFQGGKIRVERPRVRDKATGSEIPLPGREEVRDGGFLEQWATSPMLVNGQARKAGHGSGIGRVPGLPGA